MTTTLPRPIAPGNIKPGQRVRAEATHLGDLDLYEFTVISAAEDIIRGRWVMASPDRYTWTLLEDVPEPEPVREVGSRWLGTVQGGTVEYVLNQNGDYLPVRMPEGWSVATLRRGYNDDEIARLTPIPAFDPAVLWPDSPSIGTWCMERMTPVGRTCTRLDGHDGLHAAYGPDEGAPPTYVWGDPQ